MKIEAKFRLLSAARLVDGLGGPVRERAAVLLEDNNITQIGTEETVSVPEGVPVEKIDFGERTILPGLVDCHVHLIGIGDGRSGEELATLPDEVLTLQAARNARSHLFSGVTTVRDCGSKNQTAFLLRRAVDMGITPAPRLILAGRPLTLSGGHLSYFGARPTGPVECQAAVRQLLKEGADFVKIVATGGMTKTSSTQPPSFGVAELKTICDEIHNFGKHAVARCTSSKSMDNVLEAGIDTITHGIHKEPDGSTRYRPEISERIAEQGVFVNPAMYALRIRVEELEIKQDQEGLIATEQSKLDELRAEHEVRLDHFRRMREAGVTMVCGSDSAWGHYRMGNFQGELEEAVAGGMSPMGSILAATRDSADSCWLNDVGSLEQGKQADLLVVDGDPTRNIKDLRKVIEVIQSGKTVYQGNKE
ncbi:MAG: hypothetical protein BZY82_06680 [SAR202 cluster bacterium Io17-Chloro-G3]|nr:MAG: hypothetical protein BZY82_06680 [SAR202 cluster bacterium Io17-Chloro-G3]